MATVQSRGSSIVATVLTTWASTANAYDGAVGTTPATYATYVNASRSTTGSITIGGYSFSGAVGTINSVTAAINHKETSTSVISNVTVQLQDSTGANIGSAVAATRATTAATNTLTLGTPTLAQVQAGLRVLVSVVRSNSTTSTTFSLDYVDLTVDYTPPPTPAGYVSGFAQYLTDHKTPLAVGAETTSAGLGSNNLYLQFLIANTNDQTNDNYPGVEVKPIGIPFTGTANYTALSFQAQESYEPTAMRGGIMGYDAVNDRFIMTDGYDGTTRFNDVWELDASGLAGKWKKLTVGGSTVAGKNLGASTMINQNGKAWWVRWGGNTGSDTNDMEIMDVTTRGSETYTTITQTNALTARSYITLHMCNVPTSSTTTDVYYFGGWASSRENVLVKTTINTSGSVPTALTWTTVTANGATGSPPARSGTILFYDPTNNRLIVHGGYGSAGLNDTWAFSLTSNTWSQLSPTGTLPVGRELFAAAYDPPSQRLVVAGGWSTEAVTNNRNDIYQIDFSTSTDGVITELRAHDYPNCEIDPFSSIAVAYDSDRRMFATSGLNGYDGTDRYSYAFDFTETVVADQMTLYGLNIIDWQRARDAPAHCKNTDANEFLMINGFSGMPDDTLAANSLNGDHMNEIWVYSPTANTVRYGNAGIFGQTYREGVFAAYDPVGHRVICFGGLTGATQVSNGTWELKRDIYGNYQARRMYPGGTLPTPRWLMAGAFDSANNRLVVWGGTTASAMQDSSLHILDFSGGGDGVWSTVTAGGTTPPVVWQPWYAHDHTNNRLFVTSGATNFGASTFSTRTDYLDLSLSTPAWTNINTTGVTGGRGGCLAYNPSANALYAFGGYNGSTVTNQAWEMPLSGTTWTASSPTTSLPSARRSAAVWWDDSNDGMLISSGRPVSGQWYRDYKLYTPAYEYGAAGWFDRAPTVYLHDSVKVTNLANNTSYHWQGVDTILGTSITGNFGTNDTGSTSTTYYFDGHTSITDPNNQWTNDANAFDGNTATSATSGTTAGSTSSNYLYGIGTTAPLGGNTITQVQARVYGSASGGLTGTVDIFNSNLATQLGSITVSGFPAAYTGYTTLTAPAGGWSWSAINSLEVLAFPNGGNNINIAVIEVLVTYATTAGTDFSIAMTTGTNDYTRTNVTSLPTTSSDLATSFSSTEYTNVATTDSTFVAQASSNTNVFEFKQRHANNTDNITGTWTGKTDTAGSTKTIYLQIWNNNTSAWETIASNATVAANTSFTLTGTKSSSVGNYYDNLNVVTFRVYQ